MTTLKRASVALTALLCAATMTASAEAHGFGGGHFSGGHFGGHFGHVGHIGHPGHFGHVGHHFGHRYVYGPAFGVGLNDPYYSYDDDDSCYRVYRYHAWRMVCD